MIPKVAVNIVMVNRTTSKYGTSGCGSPIRLTDRESRNSSKRRYIIEKTRTIANVYRHYINCYFYAIRHTNVISVLANWLYHQYACFLYRHRAINYGFSESN